MVRSFTPTAVAVSIMLTTVALAQPITLVDGGATRYSIYHAPDAPTSVRSAAIELQRVLQIATGVELPIVTEPASPMIALGDSPAADAAGLRGTEIPFEGYRILTSGENLFIVGHDTADDQEIWMFQVSKGTFYGAHAFMEDVVGARWLMPGAAGEDIPHHDTLTVPDLDLTRSPSIPFRALAYVQDRTGSVKVWKARHGIHDRYWVSFPHAYHNYPPNAVLREHPEYMAMYASGIRQPVPEGRSLNHKYCLTQPGLVDAFADAIIATFDAQPDRYHATMSPADGGGFCECPECNKYRETDDAGLWGDFAERGWSITPVILRFYNQVARRVAQKYPDRTIGGLIYNAYTYPPKEPVAMEPNVVLNIAALDHYGYKLYKPARADELSRLMPAWSQSTDRLAWSDYSTWMRDWYGVPLPPGLPIIEMIFKQFRQHPVMLINYTGHAAWGTGGVHNYIIAKLQWDPTRDVQELYHEYLDRAYGAEAARQIDRIYQLSEEALSSYIRANPGHRQPSYDVTHELVAKYYGPRFAEIEGAYTAAAATEMTVPQRTRLEMFGAVLTLLRENLVRAGVVETNPDSLLHKSPDAFAEFLAEQAPGLALNEAMKPREDGSRRILFAPEERTLLISRLPADAEAPVIDGDLSDAAWGEAAEATDFRLRGSRTEAPHRTEVRVACDDQRLYVAARMFDDQLDLLGHATTERDTEALFSDDTFELFFSSKINFEVNYWHIAFNAAGGVWDDVALERDYDLQFESRAAIEDDSWTVEIAIPFASMRLPGLPAGKSWRGNFSRIRRAGTRELSSWAGIEDTFHEPKSFGTFVFGE